MYQHMRQHLCADRICIVKAFRQEIVRYFPRIRVIQENCADNHICRRFCRFPHERLVHIPVNPVIAVHKSDVVAVRHSKTALACRHKSLVLLMQHRYALIRQAICIADGTGCVRAAVINQNQLKIRIGLT